VNISTKNFRKKQETGVFILMVTFEVQSGRIDEV